MRRSALNRGTKPLRRKTRLRPISPKRASESKVRARLVRAQLRQHKWCEWPGCTVPASDCHERETRARYPGSHLRPETFVSLCRAHHTRTHDHPSEATALGLLVPSSSRSSDPDAVAGSPIRSVVAARSPSTDGSSGGRDGSQRGAA